MRLVNHDGRILPKEPVAAEFLQQDAVRHHLDGSIALALFPEADFRGDERFVLEFFAQAVRNGNRRKPAGFRHTDFETTHVIPAEAGISFSNTIHEILAFARMTNCSIPFQQELRQLRRLAGTGICLDNHYLVFFEQIEKLFPMFNNRKVRVGNFQVLVRHLAMDN